MLKRLAVLFTCTLPRRSLRALPLLVATAAAISAHASPLPFPPLTTEAFNPPNTLTGEVSTMTIAFSNPNVSAINGVSFTDTYPFGMLNAPGNPVLANTCGGTVTTGTADSDGFSLSLSGASIDTTGCYLQIAVIGTVAGSLQNDTGTISSTSAPPGAEAIATLFVADGSVLSAPTVNKSFSPSSVAPGGASQMTITLTNSDPSRALVGVHFSDVYPAGMQQASFGVVASNTCGGDVMPFGASLDLDNGTVPPGGSCSVVANMIGNATAINSTGPVTSDNAQTASAALAVLTVTGGVPVPDLTLTKSHAGDFFQGQAGATYQLVATNIGAAPTTGTFTVTDTLPVGLTATDMNGTGWTCDVQTTSCTYSDPLAPGTSAPGITLTVSVAANAPVSVTNTAVVAGGGETDTSDDAASDPTTIGAASPSPDMTLTLSHSNDFTQGQSGAILVLTVQNVGALTSSGSVVVTDTVPAGLTATSIGGAGWICNPYTTTCMRSDPLPNGASYPEILLVVDVAADAPSTLLNAAHVTGGGEINTGNDAAGDLVTIVATPGTTQQTILFTSVAPSAAIVAGPAYQASATATSQLPVVLTIDPSAATVCSIDGGGMVSFIGAGACLIDANQAGDASYAAAPQVQQSFAVASAGGQTPQTITFSSAAPGNAMVGAPGYLPIAVAEPSHLPVVLTIDASAATVCAMNSSGIVSFVGAGTCTIDANQGGNAMYAPAPQVQQSFVVSPAGGLTPQSIVFTSVAPSDAHVTGPMYHVTAAADSGLPVVLTIDASSATVCTISNDLVNFVSAGTCTIDANQGGGFNGGIDYAPAPQVQQSFAVADAGGQFQQSIAFTSAAPTNAIVGGAAYVPIAVAVPSHLPVMFAIDGASANVCTMTNGTVSFIGAGICTIDATQGGDATYEPAPEVQQSFDVAPAAGQTPQSISFSSGAPTAATVAGPTYLAVATADSHLTVVLTIDGASATVCAIDHGTVSFIGAGTCTIDANQGGDATFAAAPQVQQSFAVAPAAGMTPQQIVFTSTPPNPAVVAGTTYLATAVADSPLSVVLTIDGPSAGVCTIDHGNVSFIGVGTCVIDANQGGDSTYAAAPQMQQSFPVINAGGGTPQAITFASTAPLHAIVGGDTYLALATATSQLPVLLTIDAGSASVCTINQGTVSFIGAGTCTIDANQGGDANYAPAPEVQQPFTVSVAVAPTVLCTLATQTGVVGDTVSIDLSLLFAPPANDTLTYSATNLPPSLSITGALLTGTLQAGDVLSSPYTSTLKASAVLGGGSATEDVAFVVLPLGEVLLSDGFDGPDAAPACH